MALSKIDAANFLDGTLPDTNINNASLDNVTGLPAGVGGKVLQVVNATKTDTFATSSSSFVDIPGLSASITPSSTSNKIFVSLTLYVGDDTQTANVICNIVRDSTQLQETVARLPQEGQSVYRMYNLSMTDYDSPASVSSLTYKSQIKTNAGTGVVNKAANQGGFSNTATATLTLMEVAG